MDLAAILSELYARKKVLEHAIAELEQLQSSGRSLRGRKFMDVAERQKMSARMKAN